MVLNPALQGIAIGFIIVMLVPVVLSIKRRYFPSSPEPEKKDIWTLTRDLARDNEKKRRRQEYAFNFIESQQLNADFDEYCDAMELMRTMQRQEEAQK